MVRMRERGARWVQVIVMAGTAVLMAGVAPASGQATKMKSVEPFLMERAKEIALARSAGPRGIGAEATVLVLTRKGYERAVEGTNGFTCFVGRSWSGPGLVTVRDGKRVVGPDALSPEVIAPHCFNAVASGSIVPWHELVTDALLSGAAVETVPDLTAAALEDGRLRPPPANAFAYMTSMDQQLGSAGRWRPHVMLYAPYSTNSMWGAAGLNPDFPFVSGEGTPWSIVVIPIAKFSNGQTGEMSASR